jgi:hypothetical protein
VHEVDCCLHVVGMSQLTSAGRGEGLMAWAGTPLQTTACITKG